MSELDEAAADGMVDGVPMEATRLLDTLLLFSILLGLLLLLQLLQIFFL